MKRRLLRSPESAMHRFQIVTCASQILLGEAEVLEKFPPIIPFADVRPYFLHLTSFPETMESSKNHTGRTRSLPAGNTHIVLVDSTEGERW